jgi:ATP-dependent DNA helicase RecG
LLDKAPVTGERSLKFVPSGICISLLEIASNPISTGMLMKAAGQTNRPRFRKSILRPHLEARLIEMTILDKLRSSKQKYRLTKKAASYWRSTPKEKKEMNKN